MPFKNFARAHSAARERLSVLLKMGTGIFVIMHTIFASVK